MKQRLLIVLFALSLFFTSCGSDNDLMGNWIKSSSFEGRARSGAVSFVIGDYAYVGTGYDGKNALKTFYKYSLQNGWSKVDNDFPGKARREAVAFEANGKVYVGLGVDDDDERLGDFFEFDPTTDTWNPTAIDMTGGPSARQGAVAFSINGVGYVGTGYGFQEGEDRTNLKNFYKYDGSWTKIAFDGDKTRNSTAFVIDNKAYVVSGEGDNWKYVWEYDPAKVSNTFNGWTRKEDLDEDNRWEDVQRAQAVSFVINGKGYIATGRTRNGLSREVWEYNPTRDEWDEKTELESPEVQPRQDAVAFTLNNRAFVTTGTAGSGYYDDTWEFNPTMDEDDKDN